MLATSPFHAPSSSPPFAFLPTHPSPLSPRSANIHGPRANIFMSGTEKTHTGQENNDSNDGAHVPFAKRAVKKVPSPKQDELKERRRSMFLRKVKEGREDRRFEARGEDIMRLDFMQRRKQWEAEQAREAPFIPSDPPEPEEDDYDLPMSSNGAMQFSQPATQLPALAEEEVDEVAQMEDRELEALLEFMPVDGLEREQGEETQQAQNLWSDDDDYEELFSELMEQDEGQGHAAVVQVYTQEQGPAQQQTSTQEGEAMDMS